MEYNDSLGNLKLYLEPRNPSRLSEKVPTPPYDLSSNQEDPFLDASKPAAVKLTRSDIPLREQQQQQLPRATTFASSNYSRSPGDVPRDDSNYSFASYVPSQDELALPPRFPRVYTTESFVDSSHGDMSEYDYTRATSNLRAVFVGLEPLSPEQSDEYLPPRLQPSNPLKDSMSSSLTNFDQIVNAARDGSSPLIEDSLPHHVYDGGFVPQNSSSPLHDGSSTPLRPQHSDEPVPITPANYPAVNPQIRRLAGGAQSKIYHSSPYSLNRDVRLREASKQQETHLNQERARDDTLRVSYQGVPHLRPSPVALRVAAQLVRDSPAGQLPIGPQAVLRSKLFWVGVVISNIAIISTAAAITSIVSHKNAFTNDYTMGTKKVFWLTISLIGIFAGTIVAVLAYIRKMGYCGNMQELLGHNEVGLVDRLLRRNRASQEPELGHSLNTIQSPGTTPGLRRGLYAIQGSIGRFTQEFSINTLNPEWKELYMTPEQLRQHLSQTNLDQETPSKHGPKHPVHTGSTSVINLQSALAEIEIINPPGQTPHPTTLKIEVNSFQTTGNTPSKPSPASAPSAEDIAPIPAPAPAKRKTLNIFKRFSKQSAATAEPVVVPEPAGALGSDWAPIPTASNYNPFFQIVHDDSPVRENDGWVEVDMTEALRTIEVAKASLLKAAEIQKVDVDIWSPLENLTRDINSEHVRNLPEPLRREAILGKRKISADQAHQVRQSLVSSGSSFHRTIPRRTSDATVNKAEASGETGRSSDDMDIGRMHAKRGSVFDEHGEKVEMSTLQTSEPNPTGNATGRDDSSPGLNRRRGSAEKKKMLTSFDHFTETKKRNISGAVKEKIVKLREESSRSAR